MPTEAFDEAFSSSGLLTTEPCATVTTMPCPTPRPAVRRRRWRSTREEHAAEDIKHIPPTKVRLPAARSLPLGLADGGHAALRRGEPSCRKSGARSRSGRGGSAGGQRARRLRRRTPHWRCAQQPAHCRVAARAGGWSVRVLVVRVACRLELGEKFILASRGGKGPQP